MIRVTAQFTGRVQGVGFRYTTVEIAQRFAVAGTVQNMPDGTVQLIAEGQPQELDDFLDAIQRRMSRHIVDTRLDRGPATGEFGPPGSGDVFTIRY